jgi:hypothetical protein
VDDKHQKAPEEIADVVIVLYRLASRLGVDLHQEVEKKMAINRNREWKLDNSGHGYHVRDKGDAKATEAIPEVKTPEVATITYRYRWCYSEGFGRWFTICLPSGLSVDQLNERFDYIETSEGPSHGCRWSGFQYEPRADIGHHILATKFSDGSPSEKFFIGFVSEYLPDGNYRLVDNWGGIERSSEYLRCEIITRDEGIALTRALPGLFNKSVSLWGVLAQLRTEMNRGKREKCHQCGKQVETVSSPFCSTICETLFKQDRNE